MSPGIRATAEDFKPGVQHICVPNAARDGWDCGTVDDPPKPAVVKEQTRDEPAPPPPLFLADPARPRDSTDDQVEQAVAQPESATLPVQDVASEVAPVAVAPVEVSPAAPEPTPVVDAVAEPLPSAAMSEDATAAEAVPDAIPTTMESRPIVEPTVVAAEALPEALPEPAATLAVPVPLPTAAVTVDEVPAATAAEQAPEPVIAPELETVPEPERAPEPVVARTSAAPETSEPVTLEAMPDPSPPAEPEPQTVPIAVARSQPATAAPHAPTGRLYLASLQGARAFAQLPPGYFTLQLAHAASAENFPTLIQQLGINHHQCYVLRVRRTDGDWWVLAYGSFEDVNAAKAALVDVRPAPGMTAVWPRRIGYLQSEYRP